MVYWIATLSLKASGRRLPEFSLSFALLELAFFLVSALIIWNGGPSVESSAGILLVFYALVVGVTDFSHNIIPDRITLPYVGLGLLTSVVSPNISIVESLFGGLTGLTLLYVVAPVGRMLFRRETLGGGDIKLMAMCGTFVGWQGVLLTVFLGSILALTHAGGMKVVQPAAETRLVPFGPFLAAAGLVAFFFGVQIIEFYCRLAGL